jgi:molybdate transport system substrate-binding protein
MAEVAQELAHAFGAEQRCEVTFDLGGSETLLPKVAAGTTADVFICHDPFEAKVRELKKLSGSVAVGYLEPIVVVRPGNPRHLATLADLAAPGLALGIGNPRYSTCGQMFVECLKKNGIEETVRRNVKLEGRTHTELGLGVIGGPLDAAVVWNFIERSYTGKLERAPITADYEPVRITVLGLNGAAQPALRDAFLEYCRRPTAAELFRTFGYTRGMDAAR